MECGRSSIPPRFRIFPIFTATHFRKAYLEAEDAKLFERQVKARDLYSRMMRTLAETGNGWMTFKDACNRKSNQTGLAAKRRSPLESLHGDHGSHVAGGNRRLQSRLDQSGAAHDGRRVRFRKACGDRAPRRSVSRSRDRHQLLSDRGSRGLESPMASCRARASWACRMSSSR